jgi:prepilin-type N-terminal cleavage/methylation domain-containing protein
MNKVYGMRKGVTVIELMVVMVIIAIMGIFMTPAIQGWVENYRIKQAGRKMLSDLQFSEMAAISRGKYCTVTFNATVAGKQYDYIVFPDDDGDLELDLGTDEETHVYKKVIWADEYRHVGFDSTQGGGDGITFTNNDNGQPSVAFDAWGLPRDNVGQMLNEGSIYLQHTRINKARRIRVSPAGRIGIDEY